jgi:hypothetical protein
MSADQLALPGWRVVLAMSFPQLLRVDTEDAGDLGVAEAGAPSVAVGVPLAHALLLPFPFGDLVAEAGEGLASVAGGLELLAGELLPGRRRHGLLAVGRVGEVDAEPVFGGLVGG